MNTRDMRQTAERLRLLSLIFVKVTRAALEKRLKKAGVGITAIQYAVLKILKHADAGTISGLSKRMLLEPATLVPVVDALVKRGLVVRTTNPEDRRSHPLVLSAKGKSVLERVPIIDEKDSIVKSLGKMHARKLSQLALLLTEAVSDLPEGKMLLQRMTEKHGKTSA